MCEEGREVTLTQGRSAIVCLCNYDRVSELKWYYDAYNDCAVRNIRLSDGRRRPQYLSRFLLPPPPGCWVDHINGNRLDNRLSNLRLASPSENGCNRSKTRSNTSGFKGVTWNKNKGFWVAQIKTDYRNHFVGHFDTALEAAKAYDASAILHHGEYARLNFPNVVADKCQ